MRRWHMLSCSVFASVKVLNDCCSHAGIQLFLGHLHSHPVGALNLKRKELGR